MVNHLFSIFECSSLRRQTPVEQFFFLISHGSNKHKPSCLYVMTASPSSLCCELLQDRNLAFGGSYPDLQDENGPIWGRTLANREIRDSV